MNLQRQNTEIEDQAHKMWAEGSCDNEPTNDEIVIFMTECGWAIYNINISFDNMQGFWRWNCDLADKI